MIKTTTQHDIVKYLYDDGNTPSQEIEKHIIQSTQVADSFYELQQSKLLLNQVQYEPSKSTLDSILTYSKSKVNI